MCGGGPGVGIGVGAWPQATHPLRGCGAAPGVVALRVGVTVTSLLHLLLAGHPSSCFSKPLAKSVGFFELVSVGMKF